LATGRTTRENVRVYVNGYDMSPYGRTIGPLDIDIEMADVTSWMGTDGVHNYLPNKANISAGTLKGLFDSTATVGINDVLGTAGVPRKLMVPMGIRAAPAMGDPCFCGVFGQKGFAPGEDAGAMVTSIPFVDWDAASVINYWKPWGDLLHANAEETGVNTAAGVDGLIASSAGGWMMYQIFASNAAGTVTLSVQDSLTNLNAGFDHTLCTTSAIAFGSVPCAGVVALSNTGAGAIVRRYTRWQLAFASGMDHVSFAMALIRA
jgi:hypothetical protein